MEPAFPDAMSQARLPFIFINCYFDREVASAEAVLQLCPAHNIHICSYVYNYALAIRLFKN